MGKTKKDESGNGRPAGKRFQGLFEVFDVCARRLRNGNKLRIVLEAPYDKAEEKRLIDFKFNEVVLDMERIEIQPELPGVPGMIDEEAEAELKGAGVL